MINLDANKDYYILIDGEGYTFGGGRIFEKIEEVFEQFRSWAESDDMEDPTLKDYTLGDLMETWNITIKKYNGADFVELSDLEVSCKSEI